MAAAVRLARGDVGSRVNEEALAAFGLAVDAGTTLGDDVGIWPENWTTVEVFAAMSTQWNTAGMGGVVGLRYEALPAVMRFCGVSPAERATVFHGLRVMEGAALEDLRDGR